MEHKLKIGITGASGLIGSHIAEILSDHFELHCLHTSGFIPTILKKKPINWHKGNLLDIGVAEDFVSGMDFVIHTAAIVSFKDKDVDLMYQTNVEGTRTIVNALIGTDTKLIHISSISTLGRKDGDSPIGEDVFWNDNLSHSKYAHSKFLAEMEVFRGIAEGLDAMIFLPSIVLGNAERGGSSAAIWKQIKRFPSIAPQGANGFVDVVDVGTYVQKAIQNWKSGEKVILNGYNRSYQELYETVHEANGAAVDVKTFSPTLLMYIQPIAALFFRLFGRSFPVSKTMIETTSKSFQFDNSKSIELLGDSYTPFKESIQRLLNEQAAS